MTAGPVTLLFTDLVNSTELLARAGDEQAQRIFRAHHRLLQRCVAAHDGEEVKWLGDGLMTVFKSTADAVRCAIAMQQAARRRAAGERLAIRVGLNVGEVQREESDYFGTPVVIARRLCDHAEGGQILCSGLVSGLLAGQQAFTFRDCGLLELKGLTTPVATSEVVFEHEVPTALLNPTPFVGRAAELARLATRARETRAGSGGLVMVAGEPGIGKTRLLEEFAESSRSEGTLVLWGRCYEGEAARPYGPYIEALGDYARATGPETLRAELGFGAPPLARLVPILRERLPDVPEPVALQPDEERARLLDAAAQWLIAMAARTPVVLMLDDLHWADAASVALLRHVARFATRHRLLLLGAYRDVEVTPAQPLADALGALPRETSYEHVALTGLGSDEVNQLLEAVADQQVPAVLVTAITTETSGNPFFIREVLLHLVEDGKLIHREGQWTSALPIAELGIPHSVRQVIHRRLARLSESTNRWLRGAAGFTGTFRHDLATRVAGLDETEALDAVDEALAAQLIRVAGDAESFDFTHALVRHTLEAELSPPRRARLHRQIAEIMEDTYGDRASDHAGEIAQHYNRSAALAGAERGVRHCVLAAEHAEASAAFADAAEFFRMALALSTASDPRRPRLRARLALALIWALAAEQAEQTAREAAAALAAAEGSDAAADFMADAADAMWIATQSARAWSVAREGLQYIGARRDTTWARLMVFDIERREAADPKFPGVAVETPERLEVVARLWELPEFRHPTQQAFAYMGFRSREDVVMRVGNDPLAQMYYLGEYRKGEQLIEAATATLFERGQLALAALYLSHTARLQLQFGDLGSGMSTFARVLELDERLGHPAAVRTWIGTMLYCHTVVTGTGFELVLAAMEERLRQDLPEDRWQAASIRLMAAFCAAHVGRHDDAVRCLDATVPALDFPPGLLVNANYPVMLSIAAFTLEALGRTDYVEILERNVRDKWLRPDFRSHGVEARFTLAALYGLLGRYEKASEFFTEAREIFTEQENVFRVRPDYYEARMYLRRGEPGDRERAVCLLHTALENFRALGMTGWAERAEQELAAAVTGDTSIGEPTSRDVDAPVATSATSAFVVARLHREGDYWTVVYADTTSRLRDMKGLHYLSQLLSHPAREFHALDLIRLQVGETGVDATAHRGLPVLDPQAKAAYRRRLEDLSAELAEAEQFNDTGRAERARDEMEAISAQLAAAVGLGGRDRETASAAERARMAVTQRVRAAIKRIAAQHPALADHLAGRIETGTFCVYRPDPTRPIEWNLG